MDILIVGEAYGDDARPFEGASYWMLEKSLAQVGVKLTDCHQATVFRTRVSIQSVVVGKAQGIPGMVAVLKGKYMPAEYTEHLHALYREVNDVNPNLILALGPTASWALCNTAGIKSIRGTAMGTATFPLVPSHSALRRQYKVLPTYHPNSVLRDFTLRPIFLSDLDKARRFSKTPEITRPSRAIWIEPTLADLELYERTYIQPAAQLSIDIETIGDQIDCIGFAPDAHNAIVVPFISHKRRNYWASKSDEMMAWNYVRRWCQKPAVFQNGLYDIHRLWRGYGIACTAAEDDTMLLHHALQPEMEKGLGFLSSIYTDEASWKFMRGKVETLKTED